MEQKIRSSLVELTPSAPHHIIPLLANEWRMGWTGLPSPFSPARTVDAAYPHHLAQFAVGVPAELQVVGESNIGQYRPVTLDLLVRLYPIQTRANGLVFDVAYWRPNSADDEIRYAAGNVRRFVYGTLDNAPSSPILR